MRTDVLVVGAGITGLAHAWSCVRRGLSVVVAERSASHQGASLRSFGRIAPSAMADEHEWIATRGRDQWNAASLEFGFWLDPCGTLYLAHEEDEWLALNELAARRPGLKTLDRGEVLARFHWVEPERLRGGVLALADCCVNPAEVCRKMTEGLAGSGKAAFLFGHSVTHLDGEEAIVGRKSIRFDQAFVCAGEEAASLLPHAFEGQGLERFHTQMLRTAVMQKLGAMVAGGSGVIHLPSLAASPSTSAVRARVLDDRPEKVAHGVHFLASQHQDGRLTVGASMRRDESLFRSERVDELILREARRSIGMSLRIEERWEGVVVRHPSQPFATDVVHPRVTVVSGLGFSGMAVGLAVGDVVVSHTLG